MVDDWWGLKDFVGHIEGLGKDETNGVYLLREAKKIPWLFWYWGVNKEEDKILFNIQAGVEIVLIEF